MGGCLKDFCGCDGLEGKWFKEQVICQVKGQGTLGESEDMEPCAVGRDV